MIPVPETSDVELAFSTIEHLPKWEEIPEKFKAHANPWAKLFSKWFFLGIEADELGTARPGVDHTKAVRALKAIMQSYAPKHEHKEAGVAMLIHEWFEIPGV